MNSKRAEQGKENAPLEPQREAKRFLYHGLHDDDHEESLRWYI